MKTLNYPSEEIILCGPEVWRQSISAPRFEVSSWGRIRVIPYKIPMPCGGSRSVVSKPTYGYVDDRGSYKQYRYNPGGRDKNWIVARLVCEAFNGPPFSDAECMHEDENPLNNRPENLKWGTRKQNSNYPGFLNYCRSRTGENSTCAKRRRKLENQTF